MGAQACNCDCDTDKKETTGGSQAVTSTATAAFEEDVVIKAPTVSKTLIATPSSCSPAGEKMSMSVFEDTTLTEENSAENQLFNRDDEPPQPFPPPPEPQIQKQDNEPPRPCPAPLQPQVHKQDNEPPRPCPAPVEAQVQKQGNEPARPSPSPLKPQVQKRDDDPPKAQIQMNPAELESKEIAGNATPLERRLVFVIEANKALEATFANFNGPRGAGGSSSGEGLIVTSVEDNSALKWTKDGSCGIRAGDEVLQVQGHSGGGDEFLKLLRQAKLNGGILEMVVRSRPDTFEVTIQRTSDEKMGITVSLRDDMDDKVEISSVLDEGAMQAWNCNNRTLGVVNGDLIAAVNGVSKKPSEMIQDMQNSWLKKAQIVLRIVTPAAEPECDAKKRPDS